MERASQRKPDILGAGLLGEEQFDVALLLDGVKDLVKGIKPPNRVENADLLLFKKYRPLFNINKCEVGVEIIAYFQMFVLNESIVKPNVNIKDIWNIATRASWLQAMHYTSSCKGRLAEINQQIISVVPTMKNPALQPTLKRISSVMPLLLSRIDASDYPYLCKIEGGEYVNGPTNSTPMFTVKGRLYDCTIIFGRKLVLVNLDNEAFLLTHDQWLMIHNKCVELWIVLTYAFLSEGIQFTDGFHKRILTLIKICHKLIIRYGNKAYNFMKSLEGLITGVVIDREEKWDNSELLTVMWTIIYNDQLGFPRCFYNSSLCTLFDQCTTQELIELCGTSKLTGHPDIQTETGLKSLYDRTHKHIDITYDSILEVVQMIKKDFCERYLLKHNKWPLVYIRYGCPEIFTQAIMRNKWIENPELTRVYGRSMSLEDWNFIDLGQIMEFDWVEAHMPFLKDRAIAPKLTTLVQQQTEKIYIPPQERRVLLKFLLTQNVFKLTSRYIEQYGRDPQSVIDYLVIKLTQKEKELKIGGRMFGQSPYEERFRRCIMEHNVARLMLDYDPYQSMTTSEIQKIQKLLKFRALSREVTNARVLQFSIDAEAWNNYFRPELVNVVGEEFFDRIFGTQLYRHTMTTYQYSYIYANVKGQQVGWTGQQGGIEGLSQKVWTWIYARVALRVLESLGHKGYIMVCGDDLRIAVIFPNDLFVDRTEDEIAQDFKRQLEIAFDRYGFKMKASETVSSEMFIAYGKVYQVGDSFMSGSLKKIAKIHGFQGTTFPLLEQQIASIFSNAHAACQMSTSHLVIHMLANYVTCIRLQGKVKKQLTKRELMEILNRPSVLGGYPVLHLSHFMVRGESDHLSIAFSFAFFLISSRLDVVLGWSLLCTPLSDKSQRSVLQLLTDPYCIPIDKPESATAFLKKKMEQHIRYITINKEMRDIFRLYSKAAQNSFLKAIESMNVYMAKVLAILWECSPFNIINEVIQKFENSRSVFQLLCIRRRRRNLYQLLETARQKETKVLSWIRDLANRLPETLQTFEGVTFTRIQLSTNDAHPTLPDCPTRFTQAIRDYAWGKPVTTVTYPCIVDFFTIYQDEPNLPYHVRDDHIWSILYINPDEPNHHFAKGNKTPWIGTVTSEKLILPQVSVDFEGSISSKVSKILKLVEYTRTNGEAILQAIEWILEKVSGYSLNHFYAMVPKRAGGTISHRLRSRAFNETVMFNELPNRSQLISIHHDTHVSLQEKPGDFSVNYMALLIHHATTILFPLECMQYLDARKYGTNFYSQVNTHCPSCFYDVTDIHVIHQSKDFPNIKPLPGKNPIVGYTQVLEDEMARKVRELGLRPRQRTFMAEQQADDVNEIVAKHIVASALIQESFGGSLEAYELGINIQYESHQMKMDALYNRSIRTTLSIRDWKSVDGVSLATAMIKECFQWVLRNPRLKTNRLDDIINLPPQLNPFTIIAHKLIMAHKVQEVRQGFLELNFPTRPLGALDLSSIACCSKWLLTTIYPIVQSIFKDHALEERVCIYYSYESDEMVLEKVNRLMDLSCLHFYQNILRILYIVYLLGYNIVTAIDFRFRASRIVEELNRRIREGALPIEHVNFIYQYCFRYLEDFIMEIGVFHKVEVIDFGESSWNVTGNIDPESIREFLENHLEDFMQWPLRVDIELETEDLQSLPFEVMYAIFDEFNWPMVRAYRYGLYACVSLCRRLLDEAIVEDEQPVRARSIPCQPIIIGIRENAIRDVRDLHADPIGSGGQFVADQLVRIIPVFEVHRFPVSMSQLSRINGHTITSVVKLHEIFLRLDIHEKFERAIALHWGMCLADGEGGFTNYLLKVSPRINIIFNTLYRPAPDESIAISTPGEVMLSQDIRVINRCYSHHNYTSNNDLTTLGTIRHLREIALQKTDGEGLSIITFDAEGSGIDDADTYYVLIRNICVLILQTINTTGCAIIKTFISRSHKLWSLWNTFTDIFAYIRLLKPDTSHSSNSEFYIIVANPVFQRAALDEVANAFLADRVFGPANFQFLHEAQMVCHDILHKRRALLAEEERPLNALTWAAVNWNDNRLPPFTWGIIFRRLYLTAPPNLVDPFTRTFNWSETTRNDIITVCERSIREARRTLTERESSVLEHTTHTHLCQRLAIYTRLLAFREMLIVAPHNIGHIHTPGLLMIQQNMIQQVTEIARHIAIHYDPDTQTINPGMINLEVNLAAEANAGILLGLRFRSAEHAYKYHQIHNQPPPAPIFPNYDENQILQIE